LQSKFVEHEQDLPDPQHFGIELEYIFAPDVDKMACIAYLMRQDVLTYDDLRQNTLSTYGMNASFLQMEPMKPDGENDEIVFTPMSLLAAQALVPHFDVLFASLKLQGYEPWGPMSEIGMHISVDRDKVTGEQLNRFAWWLFENNSVFKYLSGRTNWGTTRSDIRYLLGDTYRTWSKDVLRDRATDQFDLLRSAYDNYMNIDIIGIRTYTNTPYTQFTQFGSTLKSSELLSKIEFVDALLAWVFDYNDTDPHNFIKSVKETTHPNLYDSLKSLNI